MISCLLIDLDGTVYSQGRPYPGAIDTIKELDRRGMPYRFITNMTRRGRTKLAERLDRMGIPVDIKHLFIAPQAAALYCRGADHQKLWLPAGHDDLEEEFAGFTLTADAPDAVVLGDMGEQFTYAKLNEIFAALLDGAELVAMQKGRYWLTEKYGPTLDLGPFVAALEYGTGRPAVVVGKPAEAFFELAIDGWDVPLDEVAVVGDSVENQ